MSSNSNKFFGYSLTFLAITLFAIIIYIPLFLHLDNAPLYYWDESLFALRALYMAETGEYLSNFNLFESLFNHLNTKPPLMTWVQAQFFKILGYNELALRLPIALSVVFLIYHYILFSINKLNNIKIGIFSTLVLITTTGFITIHGSRTGEHDAALSVFMMLSTLYFYKFTTSKIEKEKRINLFFFLLYLIISVLIKNLMGLLFIPGYIAYLIYKKTFLNTLKYTPIYLAILMFFTCIIAVLGYLEYSYSGFINRMWNYELLGRYSKTIENHNHSFLYYFYQMWNTDFSPWILYLPITLFIIITKPTYKHRDFLIYLSLSTLSFLIIVSYSKTKLEWYDMPIYPCLAMIVGIILSILYEVLKKWIGQTHQILSQRIFPVYFMVGIFILPYQQIINQIYLPKTTEGKAQYAYMFKEISIKTPEFKTYNVCTDDHRYHATFYKEIYQKEKKADIQIIKFSELKEGDKVVVCVPEILEEVTKQYSYKVLIQKKNCVFIKILDIK